MKRIAISQSNYIPWKGYFDLIKAVDEFVLYDEVQFTKNDWRNRNQIKTSSGAKWLTIPVVTSRRHGQSILETVVVDDRWRTKHWQSWQSHYGGAAHFRAYRDELAALYLSGTERQLSLINASFLHTVAGWLGITTPIAWSQEYAHDSDDPSMRLVQICRRAGATHYLSGPAAQSYLRVELFQQAGIVVEWMNYDSYKPYRQLGSPFIPAVSAIDLVLNEGPDAPAYLKSPADCIRPIPFPTHAL